LALEVIKSIAEARLGLLVGDQAVIEIPNADRVERTQFPLVDLSLLGFWGK